MPWEEHRACELEDFGSRSEPSNARLRPVSPSVKVGQKRLAPSGPQPCRKD